MFFLWISLVILVSLWVHRAISFSFFPDLASSLSSPSKTFPLDVFIQEDLPGSSAFFRCLGHLGHQREEVRYRPWSPRERVQAGGVNGGALSIYMVLKAQRLDLGR